VPSKRAAKKFAAHPFHFQIALLEMPKPKDSPTSDQREIDPSFNPTALGWRSDFAAAFAPFAEKGLHFARIITELRGEYRVLSPFGESTAKCTGKFIHHATAPDRFPAVGDWIVVAQTPPAVPLEIRAILPRRTTISRQKSGKATKQQLIAANVDTLFLVTSLDLNFNLRRIERYLAVARQSEAFPVIVLNKSDLCPNTDEILATIHNIAGGTPVIAVSATQGDNLESFDPYLTPGATIAFIGSSGVGKSTISNALIGKYIQATGRRREGDDKGRHTTTARQLIPIPNGANLIDTPGMRELGLWEATTGITDTFEDIAQLSRQCRFTNCRHTTEPGCAIQAAIQTNEISPFRFENWIKLLAEQALTNLQRKESTNRRREKNVQKTTKSLRQNPTQDQPNLD